MRRLFMRKPPRSRPLSGLAIFRYRWKLERRAQVPGHELVVAVAEILALGLAAGSRLDNQFEDLAAHAGDGLFTGGNDAAVDVHVLFHLMIHGRVGGDLDRRRRTATEAGAAAGGEDDDVGA